MPKSDGDYLTLRVGRADDGPAEPGTPCAGWFPIRFEIGDTRHEIRASNVMNDPLEDLATTLLAILQGDREGSVHFWQEEPTAILELMVDPGREWLTVRLYETETTELEIVDGELLGVVKVPLRDGCEQILRALEAVESRSDPDVYAKEWRREFPEETLRACRDLL